MTTLLRVATLNLWGRRYWTPHLDALATELARGRRERRLRDSEQATGETDD